MKAHAGTSGNEMADSSAKKATTKRTITESYTKIPKSVLQRQLEEESARKWQESWTDTHD
jgi:ribonuclease HI